MDNNEGIKRKAKKRDTLYEIRRAPQMSRESLYMKEKKKRYVVEMTSAQ